MHTSAAKDGENTMNSEVVESDGEPASRASRRRKLRLFSFTGLLSRFIHRRRTDDDSYDPALEKERLIGQALTRREQEAYERAVSLEREAYDSTIQASGASLAGAYRDLETAIGIFRDSGIREARRLGHIFYETRKRTNGKLTAVQ